LRIKLFDVLTLVIPFITFVIKDMHSARVPILRLRQTYALASTIFKKITESLNNDLTTVQQFAKTTSLKALAKNAPPFSWCNRYIAGVTFVSVAGILQRNIDIEMINTVDGIG